MTKLYELPKDKRKYHILTDKEVIENLETSLNEKEKQIERLREQLNEANEVIKYYTDYHYELNNKGKMVYKETNTASKYLKKWGVK